MWLGDVHSIQSWPEFRGSEEGGGLLIARASNPRQVVNVSIDRSDQARMQANIQSINHSPNQSLT